MMPQLLARRWAQHLYKQNTTKRDGRMPSLFSELYRWSIDKQSFSVLYCTAWLAKANQLLSLDVALG